MTWTDSSRSSLAVLNSDEARSFLRELRKDFPLEQVIGEMRRACPEVAELPPDAQLLERVASAFASTFFDMLEEPPHVEDWQPVPPLETATFAHDLARWGVGVEVILKAYHIGNVAGWRLIRRRIARTVGDEDLRNALTELTEDINAAYIQIVMQTTIDEYMAAKAATVRSHLAQQLKLVRRILETTEPIDVGATSSRLGYDLARRHIGLVVWGATSSAALQDFSQLERATRTWLAAVGAAHSLVIPIDDRAVWAWTSLSSSEPLDVASSPSLGAAVHVAVGQPGVGLEGFRDTHDEAVEVRRLVEDLGLQQSVVRHADFETVLLVTRDRRRLKLYLEHKLDDLAADDPLTAELRDTLRTYLLSGERVTVAATTSHLHRNTVTRRVEQAIELLGRPLDQDRLGVALALELEQVHRLLR